MPNRRMLHSKISNSLAVNDLPVPARLLFTWMIAHADDEGRLKGNPRYIKYSVVPQTNWSVKIIEKYLNLMVDNQLIYYWQENKEWFIEFINWKQHQYIPKDRFHPSSLPKYGKNFSSDLYTTRIQSVHNLDSQSNRNELNIIEVNKSESNSSVADKKPHTPASILKARQFTPPQEYIVQTPAEAAAFDIYQSLEPNNPWAFYSTYLPAAHKGIPADLMYQWQSEIKQSESVTNPGKVFYSKVKKYLESHETQKSF